MQGKVVGLLLGRGAGIWAVGPRILFRARIIVARAHGRQERVLEPVAEARAQDGLAARVHGDGDCCGGEKLSCASRCTASISSTSTVQDSDCKCKDS